MRVARWFAAALAWVLAVAVVAGVAWFAIDSAGREVSAGGPVTVVPVANVSSEPTGSPGLQPPASASPSATAATTADEVPGSPTGTPTLSPSAPAPASPSGSPPASRSGTTTRPPSSPARPTAVPTPPAPTPPPGTGTGRAGTYSSVAGDLTVRCAGAGIEGWGVRPAVGWRVDAVPGPQGALVVVFTADDGRVVEVEATCRDGVPVFRASSPR